LMAERESTVGTPWGRREFVARSSRAAAALVFSGMQEPLEPASTVALTKNADKSAALKQALELMGDVDFAQKGIYLKPDFNSPHGFPASTDPDMIRDVVAHLRERNCGKITLAERSGMGETREICEKIGMPDLAKRLDFSLLPLEELPAGKWRRALEEGSHWSKGVEVPEWLTPAAPIVQICNLKTHRFGGHFSASLKNSIGLVAKHAGAGTRHNYMVELHSSADQRVMIAEVNQLYRPLLVVMDASRVFVDGGPEAGDLAYPQVVAVSRDRVALDAVGVALLRLHGAGGPVSRGSVFEQAQIKRAGELKLGSRSPKEIRILTGDDESRKVAFQVTAVLEKEEEKK
jgi:uncharacterized protein (DUF362 family)